MSHVTNTALSLQAISAALSTRMIAERTTAKQEFYELCVEAGLDLKALGIAQMMPLWELFGWEQVKFGPEHGRRSLPNWADFMKDNDVDAYMAAWNDVMEDARNEFGLPIGKSDIGIREIAGARHFDLGDHHWRLIDFLRAPTRRPHNPYLLELDSSIQAADKLGLGDGVFAVVHPEAIGYERLDELAAAGGETLLQARAFIWDKDGTCRKVFKGLVKVSDKINGQYFAAGAGYGTLREVEWGNVIEIHPMTDAIDYNPVQPRVSDQLGTYAGKDGWYNALRPGVNLKLSEAFDGAREILAGANIGFVAPAECVRVANEAFNACVSLPMGVSRKAAPGADLKPFTFRAPKRLKAQLMLGERYLIHRNPALPDGTSSWSGTCVGYTGGNFFELPTNESPLCRGADFGVWEQGGGDFDGDDVVVMPHVSNGGLVLGFNDRPEEEQRTLLEVSSAGRKGAGFNRNYASGNLRWAGQRIAAINLGMFDYAARKAIEKHHGMLGKRMAASLKAAIQWAADCQKRDLIKPEIPNWVKDLGNDWLMKAVKALTKPDADIQEVKTGFNHQWDLLQARVTVAQDVLDGAYRCDDGEKLQAFKNNVRWALGIYKQIEQQMFATRKGKLKYQGGRAYPSSSTRPEDDIHAYLAERRASLTQNGAELVDATELKVLEVLIVKARRSGRTGLASSAERLLGMFMASQDMFDAIEYSIQLDDPQLFIKLAPMDELTNCFAHIRKNKCFKRISDLSGVIVTGMSPVFKREGRKLVNQQEVMFGGLKLAAGQIEVTEKRLGMSAVKYGRFGHIMESVYELTLSVNGVPMAKVPGTTDAIHALYPELEAQVGRLADILPETLEEMI